jgi:hypothetical protein
VIFRSFEASSQRNSPANATFCGKRTAVPLADCSIFGDLPPEGRSARNSLPVLVEVLGRADIARRRPLGRKCLFYATTHQIGLSGLILVTTVVGLVIFLVAELLSPETNGKVLVADLTVA